jgi:hypothetical protein
LRYALLLIAGLCTVCPAVAADGWTSYSNPRFGYSAEVPPGFMLTQESDNGDGATFQSQDGRARLLLFGAFAEDGGLSADAHRRIAWDKQDGWKITYEKVTPGWASYSGSRAASILYVRAVMLCDGGLAYFQLKYPRAALKDYDRLVSRMVRSLRPATGCNQTPDTPPGAAPNAG